MPTLSEDEALVRLARMVAMDEEPVLYDTDLLRLLDKHKRGGTWAASTAYVYGDRVIPTVRTGKRYVCAIGGTSGTTEPDWPTTEFSRVTDGTVTWEEEGLDWTDGYDLEAAAHEAWLEKAAIAASAFRFSDGQQTFDRQQLIQHCERMARLYAPARVV